MKKLLQKTKAYFGQEILEAKNNDYDAIILPIDTDEEPGFIIDAADIEMIYEIASQNEWDIFVLIDFMRKEERVIDIFEFEAA